MALAVEAALLARQGIRFSDPMPRPDRTRVMVVANQKGGVGKTTTTVNLAAALAQLGQRVLVLDLDPQGNASTAPVGGSPPRHSVVLRRPRRRGFHRRCRAETSRFAESVRRSATIDLAGAEIELVSVVARESRLRKALAAFEPIGADSEDRLDYVLIDCPPSLGLLTLNALVAGVEMLIPIQAEYYALEGLGQLIETVEMVRAHLNQHLQISTILITMFDSRHEPRRRRRGRGA